MEPNESANDSTHGITMGAAWKQHGSPLKSHESTCTIMKARWKHPWKYMKAP